MDDITRLHGMTSQTYDEFSEKILEGSNTDLDKSDDDLTKELQKG